MASSTLGRTKQRITLHAHLIAATGDALSILEAGSSGLVLMLSLCEDDVERLVIPVNRGRLFEKPSKILIGIARGFPPEH
jgi:hypothetical protein